MRLGAFVCRGRGVEQRSSLERLHRELAQRWLEIEVAPELLQQLDGRLGIRSREVVRDLRVETDRWNAARRDAQLQHGERGSWHAQAAVGPLGDPLRQRPAHRGRAEHGDRPGVRHRGWDRSQAHPGRSAELSHKVSDL